MRPRLQLQQRTTVKTTVSRRMVITGTAIAASALVAAAIFLFGNFGNNQEALAALGANMGFENNLTEWTTVSGAWSVNSSGTYIRSGSKSVKVTLSTSGIGELKNTNCTITAPATGTNYIVVTAWAKASSGYGQMKVGYVNTLTGVTTLASSYTTLNTSGFTQVQAILSVSNLATVSPFLTAYASGGSSVIYADDVNIYTTTSSTLDNTAPTAPTAVTATSLSNIITLSWTNGTDNGSGIGGVLILRQSGVQAADQTVNDQTMYAATNASVGPTSVGSWSVIYNGTSVSTFADNPGSTGTYTYLIYMRDQATNYTTYTSAARIIVVNSLSSSVSLIASTNVDGLYLPSGCTLTISSSGTLNFRIGSTSPISGTLIHQGVIINNGIVNMGNGSWYRFDRDGDSPLMTATWQTGSNCELKGLKNYVPANMGQTFYNFKWNNTQQNSPLTVSTSLIAINDINFMDSGSGNSVRTVYVSGSIQVGGALTCTALADIQYQSSTSLNFTGTTQQTLTLLGTNTTLRKVTVNNAGGVLLMQNITVDSLTLSQGTFDLNGKTIYTTDSTTITRGAGAMTNGTLTRSPLYPNSKYNLVYISGCTTGMELTSSSTYLRHLTISRLSATATLDKTAYVNGKLILAQGKFVTGSYEISVLDNSTQAVNESNGSAYVSGNLRRAVSGSGVYGFPVGTPANREYVQLTLNGLVGVTNILATFSLSFTGLAPSCWVNGTKINTLLNCGLWTLTPNSQPTSGSYDITVIGKGYTNPAALAKYYSVIKRVDSANPWKSLGTHDNNAQSMSGGIVTAKRSALLSFSDFAIGYGVAVLPITLSSFDATVVDHGALITWVTSAEMNNAYFSLQRSANGIDYETINEQEGAGTSIIRHDYSYIDEQPLQGISYYRLEQVDFDGKSSYSPIRAVSNGATQMSSKENHQPDISIYPNPGAGVFNFNNVKTSGAHDNATVKIMDIKGQLITSQTFAEGEIVRIDLTSQPPGVYMAFVTDANDVSVSKQIIIQR